MDKIKPLTVEHCFRKVGVKHEQDVTIVTVNVDETDELRDLILKLSKYIQVF